MGEQESWLPAVLIGALRHPSNPGPPLPVVSWQKGVPSSSAIQWNRFWSLGS